jgi:hypothetical protein
MYKLASGLLNKCSFLYQALGVTKFKKYEICYFGHTLLCYLSHKAVFTLAKFRAIMPTIMLVTATRDSHHCTCLGHLG